MKKLVHISFILFLAFAFAMVGCKKMDVTPEEGVGMELPTKKQVVADEETGSVLENLKGSQGIGKGCPIDDDGIDWSDMDSVNDDDDAEEDDEQQTLVGN